MGGVERVDPAAALELGFRPPADRKRSRACLIAGSLIAISLAQSSASVAPGALANRSSVAITALTCDCVLPGSTIQMTPRPH